MANVKNAYVPGVCNIGSAERRTRLQAGWIGLAATAVLWALFFVFHVQPAWRLFLFLPAMLGASGFLQGAMSFCVNFGMRGVQNFGDRVGTVVTIEEADHRKRDRGRSRVIILYSLLIAAALAVVGLLTG